MSNSMIIDGIAASEAIDTSGEILSIEGCDISDFENGKGVLNYEHRGDDAHGASPNDIIGKIIFAKKIFSKKDCENERQEFYWNQVKLPFIYIIGRLFDGAGHPGAIAAAAIIRDQVQNNEKILVQFSIEGSTLKADGNILARSCARRCAVTLKAANKSCHSGVIDDPQATVNIPEASISSSDIIQSFSDNKKKNENISLYKRLGSVHEVSCDPVITEDLHKTLTAGSSAASAPSELVGGAALQREEIIGQEEKRKHIKNQVLAALRDYNKAEHGDFREFLKHRLPDVSDSYINKFTDLVDDYKIKKHLESVLKMERLAVDLKKTLAMMRRSVAAPPHNINWLGSNNIFSVWMSSPDNIKTLASKFAKILAGRFAIFNCNLSILEDHYGYLEGHLRPGPIDEQTLKTLDVFKASPRFQIETEQHIAEPNNNIPGQDIVAPAGSVHMEPPKPQPQLPIFEYFRVGMQEPETVEVVQNRVLLNGHELSPSEVKRLLYNVHTGLATLKYKAGIPNGS